MKTFTRILCLLLCLVLAAGLVPAAAEEEAGEGRKGSAFGWFRRLFGARD